MSEKELNQMIANNINRYMEKRGLNQKDIADYMGVSQTTASNWCNGIKLPRMDKIDKLCKLFRCNRSDLLEDPEDQSSLQDLLQNLRDNPAIGVLLSASKDLNEEDIKQLAELAKRLRASYKED